MTLSTKTKESIKTALAMTIAYGIALSLNWDNPYWAGFAVAFISLASVGQSLNKAALRMFGTLVAMVASLTLNANQQQQDLLTSTHGTVATNLVKVYKALGGGWEIRDDLDPVELLPAVMKDEMRERTGAWDGVLK